MQTKVRVDLSKRSHFLFFALCLAVLCGVVMQQLAAQVEEENAWRRTVRGWEYAHWVQNNSSPTFIPTMPGEPSALSSIRYWHRIALPVAVSSFLITFGCWVLLEIPNRGIVRRFGA